MKQQEAKDLYESVFDNEGLLRKKKLKKHMQMKNPRDIVLYSNYPSQVKKTLEKRLR